MVKAGMTTMGMAAQPTMEVPCCSMAWKPRAAPTAAMPSRMAVMTNAANAKDPSLLDAILSAMQYGCFQSTIVFNVMSVSDVVKDKKEARKAIGAGYLITILLMVCLAVFAFTTTLGWDYYGERCLEYFTNKNMKAVKAYRYLYILAVLIGPFLTLEFVWTFADIFNGL